MPMKRVDEIRGLKDLLLAAIRGGMTTVEQMHASIARRPLRALGQVPVTRIPAATARLIHDGIAGGVYGGLRGLSSLAGSAASSTAAGALRVGPIEPAVDLAIRSVVPRV